MRLRRARQVLVLVVVLSAGIAACSAPVRVAVGESAPRLSLPTLAGDRVDSASLRGRPVVVNFWATWCHACKRAIPELAAVAEESGVEVLGIALDDGGVGAVAPFVQRFGIPYTVALGDEAVFHRFQGLAIPYTLVLDAEQRIVNIYRGTVTRESLVADLALLRAAPGVKEQV